MDENKIEILITPIKREVAVPWVIEFKVKIKNSADDIKTWHDNNSDDIPGYIDRSELKNILLNIRLKLEETLIGHTPELEVNVGGSWDD